MKITKAATMLASLLFIFCIFTAGEPAKPRVIILGTMKEFYSKPLSIEDSIEYYRINTFLNYDLIKQHYKEK